MPVRKRLYTRSMGDELEYLRQHLKKDETQIVAAALRRGVFETFKSVVLKQYAANQISAQQARELLGEKVFSRVATWLSPQPPAGE
jgi:hypothetical protein